MFSIHVIPNMGSEVNCESKPTLLLVGKWIHSKLSTFHVRSNWMALGKRSRENNVFFFSSQMLTNEKLGRWLH